MNQKKLAGLMSRCIMPSWWMYCSPCSISRNNRHICRGFFKSFVLSIKHRNVDFSQYSIWMNKILKVGGRVLSVRVSIGDSEVDASPSSLSSSSSSSPSSSSLSPSSWNNTSCNFRAKWKSVAYSSLALFRMKFSKNYCPNYNFAVWKNLKPGLTKSELSTALGPTAENKVSTGPLGGSSETESWLYAEAGWNDVDHSEVASTASRFAIFSIFLICKGINESENNERWTFTLKNNVLKCYLLIITPQMVTKNESPDIVSGWNTDRIIHLKILPH